MRPETPSLTTRNELREYIKEYSNRTNGRLGVFLGYPEPDGSFDVVATCNESTAFASASVIKLLIQSTLFAQHSDDLSKLREPYGLAERNRVGGSGLFHLLDDVDPSLRDLARAMIAVSDNAATNELIDHLGIDSINQRATDLGLADTRLKYRMMVTLGDNDLEPELEIPDNKPANTISPRDSADLFADIVLEETLPPAAYEEMRVPLREQKYISHFPRYLPHETHVEHKTGWIPSAALDTGLIVTGRATRERPLLFATFVDQAGHGADGGDVLAELGDAVSAWLHDD